MAASAGREMLAFDKELYALSESKLPVSASRITTLTKLAIVHIKLYKHIVHSIEKFVQKCQPDYKLAGLYVIDSILRASLKPTAKEKAPTTSVYVRRFEEKLENIFTNLVQANLKDRTRMKRVVALWVKSNILSSEQLEVIDKAYFSDIDLSEESATTNKEDQRSRSSSSKNSSSSNIGDVEDTTKRSEQFDTHGWDSQNRNIASSTVSSAVNSPLHTLPNTLQNTVLDQLNQAPHHSSIPALPVLPAIPLLNDIQNESLTTIGAVSDSGISEPQVSTLADPLFDFDYGDEDDLLSSVIPLGSTSQSEASLTSDTISMHASSSNTSTLQNTSTADKVMQNTLTTGTPAVVSSSNQTAAQHTLNNLLGFTSLTGLSGLAELSKLRNSTGDKTLLLANPTAAVPPVPATSSGYSDLESISASMFSYTASSTQSDTHIAHMPSLSDLSSSMFDLNKHTLLKEQDPPSLADSIPIHSTAPLETGHDARLVIENRLNSRGKREFQDVDVDYSSDTNRTQMARLV
ncbi:hypothetical protein BDV3_000525 [Batrachochytrium dendrobatidis]|uniref:CID domain-containing protein n=1 Tax=Batrachochytrium dendrobatidis (strain JEL423) TaxID=403673 RepID=A0A177WBU2_BATDL|nr:hypothetical protein BDEG_21559 [Batrachochytrium dendrobatidis JEL423]